MFKMGSKLHHIIKSNYSRRAEGLLLHKYGMRKGSKLEIKHEMVEKKDFSWGAFVKSHERAACQLRDNVLGKSITTCNLADLAAFVGDARSQDERRLFCKDSSISQEYKDSIFTCKYVFLYTMWQYWHVGNITDLSWSSSQLGIPWFSFPHDLIWL